MEQQPPRPPLPPREYRPQGLYAPQEPPTTPGYVIDQSAARVLSALAHGAIAFGFLGLGFLVSLAISGIIWLYGRRSPQVRFHAEQAGCYQCSVLLINIFFVALLGVTGGFSLFNILQGRSDWSLGHATIIGLFLFLAWFGASILYGIYAAMMVLAGKQFKYPFIGDRFKQ